MRTRQDGQPATAQKEPAVTLQTEAAGKQLHGHGEQAAEEPKIAFDAAVYDFGEVGPGTKQTGRLQFLNAGGCPLKITEVKPCCGIAATLDDDKEVYAPGERGIIELQYTSSARPGLVARHIYVSSNDPANPRVDLTIKAKVVLKVDYEPQTVQLSVVTGQAPNPTLTLTSTDGSPFSITSFAASNRCVTTQIDPATTATSFVLPLELDADRLGDRINGMIALGLTHPQCGRLEIPFRVRQKYQVAPAQLVLFNTVPQQAVTRALSIVSDVNTDFTIDSVESEKGFAKVTGTEKIANGYRLHIEVTPPVPDEKGVYSDTVNVSLKGGEKLTINTYIYYLNQRRTEDHPRG